MAHEIVNFITKRKWMGEKILIEKPLTYPQDWLNLTIKPSLSIGFSSNTLDELAQDCHLRYQSGNLNLTAVKAFLAKYFQEVVVQELTGDWTANGRSIGKLGDKISPLNLLDITEFENGGDLHGTKEITDKDLLAGGLLLIYRCIRIPSGGYENDFLTTLMTRAKVLHRDTVKTTVRCFSDFS
ncbi:hypothetical protein RUM43_009203 [Polyplax serrata]|uniref:Rhabdovirus nucleocapsid domain-containing protein n=1 Tax=Polyplax serrata TaxID=468196 RepID=A0AAN8NPX8_POLSC